MSELIPLKYVAATNQHALPDSTEEGFAFRYIDIGSVSSTGGVAIPPELTTFKDAPSRARRLAPAGATVVSTVRTYLRAVARVPEHEDPLVFSTGFAVLEPGPKLDARYLYYVCRSDTFVDEVASRSVGVSYPAINASDLVRIKIPVPALDAQRRVAEHLDARLTVLDELLGLRLRQIQTLLDRRRAHLLSAVTGASDPSAQPSTLHWAHRLREGWPTVRITHLARLGSGHTPSRSVPEWWVDCDVPWITTGEVQRVRDDRLEALTKTRENISWLGVENSSAELHPAGTVVLSRTASAGYSAVMGTDMATSQDFVTWTCGPDLHPYYLLWCLRAMRPDLLGRLAMGSTHKTIYVPDIQTLRIPLPPMAEQQRIVEQIRAENARIDRAVDLMREHADRLQERKQAIISRTISDAFDHQPRSAA